MSTVITCMIHIGIKQNILPLLAPVYRCNEWCCIQNCLSVQDPKKNKMNFILLSVFITYATCMNIEENEIVPLPMKLESARALLRSQEEHKDNSIKYSPLPAPENSKMLSKIRRKRGGCCSMPPPDPPSRTYILEIKTQPAPPPRYRAPPPPPPPPPQHPAQSEYVLVPVAVVQPVAVHPAPVQPVHPPPRPPRMQHPPMYHPPSTITITGTITKGGGGCPSYSRC
ncbi:hypothetical protein WA026_020638 [Henosepilachna vigintioctopunctata]|uniref:Uncharacterized protein n=1 Tax=Henosepilachna vigintioctopunctata TaxID=420089 RepID=A0AAW1UXK3_9CUCU